MFTVEEGVIVSGPKTVPRVSPWDASEMYVSIGSAATSPTAMFTSVTNPFTVTARLPFNTFKNHEPTFF
jgi:hypothetical protein